MLSLQILKINKPKAFDFPKLQKEINALPCRDNIRCILLYGSLFHKKCSKVRDSDIIVVLDKLEIDSLELFKFIFKRFPNPDFHVYSFEEVKRDISFFTREYVLEYLSKGYCLFGQNIFSEAFNNVTKKQYNESIFIRSVEHVQMVRKIFFSNKKTSKYKLHYVKKYCIRLSKNILCFKGLADHTSLEELSNQEVLETMLKNEFIKDCPTNFAELVDLKAAFRLFCDVSLNLTKLRVTL